MTDTFDIVRLKREVLTMCNSTGLSETQILDAIVNLCQPEPVVTEYVGQTGAEADAYLRGWEAGVKQAAAAPSPVEHTVAVQIEVDRDGQRWCLRSLIGHPLFDATHERWQPDKTYRIDVPRIELHFRDGVPIAYTKDGVRVEVAMVGDWTCAACQFTIHGVHQIVTDDGPTDEWQIPPCEHCAAAASQELAEAEADRDDAHRRIDLAKADYEGLLKAATKWKGHYDEAVVEIERMRQRVLNSARTREDGMIEQFEAFKAKVLAKSHKIIHRLLLPNISKGLDASYELAALCQPAKPDDALDGEATDG